MAAWVERNLCADPDDLKPCILRSRCRTGRCEFSARLLLRPPVTCFPVMLSANYLFASSLKAAEISVITPLSFLQLIWAALVGFFFFGEVPEVFVWIGGLMIFTATTFLAIREHSLSKAESKTEPVRD